MTKPKVVVAEAIADAGIAALERECIVDRAEGADRSELLSRVSDAHALVVRSATAVDAEMIAAAPELKVVGRAGVGVDNIDIDAATEAGVMVVNAPDANTISAAEHTMALILAQARRVPEADASLRGGSWERKKLKGMELNGKTLGVVGMGRIGTLVAQRASAFGMRIAAYDPYVSEERARRLGVELMDLDALLGAADFITVHLPRTRETENLISDEAIAKMKPSARVVNVARGGIVDEDAVARAVSEGRLGGAAIDVFASEPVTASPLFELSQVVVTPHLGASTQEAQDRAGTDVAIAVVEALAGGLVSSAVNLDMGPEVSEEIRPFLPVAESLGRIFVRHGRGLPGELTVCAQGKLAEFSARPLALAALRGALDSISDEPVTYVNAPRMAEARGVVITEERRSESADFQSMVVVTGEVNGVARTIAGTVMARKGPVLTEVDGYEIELPLTEHMLIVRNDDVPGVIGRVGTYLGSCSVNIADMVVGRSPEGQAAMMGLSLDAALNDEQLDGFMLLEGIVAARYLELPGYNSGETAQPTASA
ncbi:MAG: phosphoglycerate dehydrogenase [Acidimicrobiia bacterium]|nr:phosphoglycerate dehydrogenase [Acidimicrobiia bacterium]